MTGTDLALSIALGTGLAAAVGLRVFVPMLILSIAAFTGHLHLSSGLEWLGTAPAMVMLGIAAVLEVLAYYVPGLDHLLDTLAAPAALIAGTVAAAAVMADLPPILKWGTAVIAGGGAAGITQGLTSLLRVKSAVLTGGLANPVVSSAELGGAVALSLLALAAPVIAVAVVAAFLWYGVRAARRLLRRRTAAGSPPPPAAS
ncbi:MAG: DUF4126 domain-containing protein [Proteobacteria bacterium]|nr:DUF4126 domain-containing protein [Pseudomonadota bacterium]